jgi:solute carrier family 25 aspartate/glutamate transporter 12/13
MSPFTRLFPTVHCDSEEKSGSITSSALSTVRNAVAVPESELKRWRRTFDANAKVIVDGEK